MACILTARLSFLFFGYLFILSCIMGSSQSSPADVARGENVVERLNALQFNEKIRQQDEDEYVQVDSTSSRYRGSETVSIATAEAWEKELLADPKVRTSMLLNSRLTSAEPTCPLRTPFQPPRLDHLTDRSHPRRYTNLQYQDPLGRRTHHKSKI
jgi:hypothetical protein